MTKYPVARPSLADLEEKYASDAIRSGWISSTGPYLERFETEFAVRAGTTAAVATNNGTTALHLVLAAAGIGPGDEVIVPALTYVATANAVTYCGARPVFVDVDPQSWCIDPEQVAAAVTPRTRAVLAVDLYGHPADYARLREICTAHGLRLVADAAESLSGSLRGKPVGALADATTFSFFGNKILTCGEGGCVTTSDPDLAARMRLLRNQGMDPDRRYFFPVVGYNYRLTNVAAAILCAQLERCDVMVARRRAIVDAYDRYSAASPLLSAPVTAPDVTRAPWMASLVLNRDAGFDRERLTGRLSDAGVDTRPFFHPLPALPAYGSLPVDAYPVSGDLSRRGFNMPTFVDMSQDDVEAILQRLDDALRGCRAETALR
ncbi:DegT/DnrJ/EryC1/StrS family aminotransferase [Krasilnikovia sp. MM14-A1004]|uniref:DegT/DnrJ/EryC1/StrS family aminotransferase n=1 Tax=Krasilnikovia sp. MM14-A1004 TaxID=3373541 RepID=UPI00399CE440